jgi:hypothetical protein
VTRNLLGGSEARHRAARAADELAASLRGLQMLGLDVYEMGLVVGLDHHIVYRLLHAWGLDR